MAYIPWSVVFGEQPSAAKWSILGANDASFNDGSGIGTSAITTPKVKLTSLNPTLTVVSSSSPANATTTISSDFAYTSGSTAERLFVWWYVNGNSAGVVGSSLKLYNNGVALPNYANNDGPAGITTQHGSFEVIDTAANTLNTMNIRVVQGAGAAFNTSYCALKGFAISNA